MKIGLDNVPKTFPGTYSQHLASLLAKYAPEHEYVIDGKRYGEVDIYHGLRLPMPLSVRLRGVRSVVTVPDLNFLRYPHMYTLFDRIVRLRLYKYVCRRADCLIAMNRRAKEELIEQLAIDERKIKVLISLAVHPPVEAEPTETEVVTIRKKYSLPENFVLMVGVVEPRHNQLEALEAMIDVDGDISLVICGRRTKYADLILNYARAVGDATEVEFVYEPDAADLPVLFRMARAFIYIPDAEAEASVLPVVEAMRAGVPMILSDTPVHREVAADAAVYVPKGAADRLTAALECVLCDDESRRDLIAREQARAELFSEYAVAQRLIDIYTAL